MQTSLFLAFTLHTPTFAIADHKNTLLHRSNVDDQLIPMWIAEQTMRIVSKTQYDWKYIGTAGILR